MSDDWKNRIGDIEDLREYNLAEAMEKFRKGMANQQPRPQTISSGFELACFLEGNLGEAILAGYKEKVSQDFNNAAALNVLKYENGVVKGSNPFAAVLINQLLPEGQRVATPADLERILKNNTLDLKGCYEDTALVLRSIEEPNKYLAGNLMQQIKSKNPKAKRPAMIPLYGLELVKDSNSPHSLSFKLIEDAQIIHAPQLRHENNQKKFSQTDKHGLPIFDEKGTRTLYTINSGLSWLYLGRYLGLGSGSEGLADSDDGGRVVVVK